jgi:hypothetical protein
MHNFTAPTPIVDLWKTARAWFADVLDAFGGPQTIQRTFDRIAVLKPPPRQLDSILNERAEYAARHVLPAFHASDSS